ncbi:glycosyltransferase [Maribacter sp. PR1]|uniref:Glycosyltransferase n=1 Tax=Maribacter cobaltidurans TaxID=1178778 RepID=A0ABU7ISR2_9FLAO|nr:MULTISPECIES: glycosyltransferase [Maribacter]MDC6388526.1 glycosyltransferase [Maribacter sp. PR1]MEE1975915.1 glycosyltransferase [Maribacter cobaltidurans]
MESKKLLVIGLMWPEPSATAAGVRMMQLLRSFIKYGYEISFVSTASKTDFSEDLGTLNIKTQYIELNSASFDEYLVQEAPDVVLFDRFLTEEQFGWRVAEHCPKALRVLDSEDLQSLRHVREACQKKGFSFSAEFWLQDDKTKREMASIFRCDLSLIISSFEMDLLIKAVKIEECLLLHQPFMFDEISQNNDWPEFEDRSDFIFIGGGKHKPNVDAIKYLQREIWPIIKASLSDAKCYIYGAYLPQSINELHNPKNNFYVRGRAGKVSEVMKLARICLAPLQYGAGIKGKLVDAMLHGTPSVTTSIGAESMHNDLDWNGHIADNPDEFAKNAIDLYTNKTSWQQAQFNGKEIINKVYSKPKLETQLLTRIEELRKNIKAHRNNNFIGSLLQHQSLQSTKYMGKWIEEKNNKVE